MSGRKDLNTPHPRWLSAAAVGKLQIQIRHHPLATGSGAEKPGGYRNLYRDSLPQRHALSPNHHLTAPPLEQKPTTIVIRLRNRRGRPEDVSSDHVLIDLARQRHMHPRSTEGPSLRCRRSESKCQSSPTLSPNQR